MKRVQSLIGSTASLLLLSVSGQALAQAATSTTSAPTSRKPSGGLEEITVTARRVNERLQRVPISVTALTSKEIAARGITTITGLAESTPNLHITEAASSKNAAVLQIRGQVQTDTIPTLDPSVGVYVDDVYYARAYSILSDLLDVRDVEILKGPQGTLYGRNTIGGAIKVTTQVPDTKGPISGYINTSYGNYNAVDTSGAINIPLIRDQLAVRYAISYHNHDGYTDSYLVPTIPSNSTAGNAGVATSLNPIRKIDSDNENTNSQRVSLRYTPTDAITVDLTGSVFRADDNGSLSVEQEGDIQKYSFGNGSPNVYSESPQRKNSFYAGLTDSVPFAKTATDTAAATLQWDITSTLTTKLILGYVNAHNRSSSNGDGSVTPSLAFFQFEPELNDESHQISAEYQLLGKALDNRLSWITGLYYFSENAKENELGGAVTVFNVPDSVNFAGTAAAKSESAYGNVAYSWTSKLRTNVGIRVNEDDKTDVGDSRIDSVVQPGYCIYSPGPGVVTSSTNGGPCSFNGGNTYRYITFDVGADYQLTKDIFLYAKIGDGYRGGGEQFRAIGPSSEIPFQPDRVLNYEIGIKSEFLNNKLRVNLGAYHTDWKDIQQTYIIVAENPRSSLPVTATVVVNQGTATVNGIEGDAIGRLTDRLTLSGDFGVNDVEFADPSLRQQLSPKLVWSVTATYAQPTAIGPLLMRLDLSHTGSFYITQTAEVPDSKLQGYTLLNGRVTLRPWPNIEISAFAKNLAGQHYFSYSEIVGYSAMFPQFYGARGSYVGAPRTYGAQLSYRF